MAETASPSLPVAAPARLPRAIGEVESWPLLRRLLREQLRPHAPRLLAAAVLMAVAAAATATSAWLLDPAIEKIFLEKDRRMLWAIPAAVVAVMLVKAFASYGESVLMNLVGQRIIADIQLRVFASLMRADLAWLHATHSGKLLANFLHDAALLREAVSKVVTGIARDALTLAFLAAVMFYQDWRLALIAMIVFPAVGVFVRRIGRRMRKASKRSMAEPGT
jgi:subfamily B ATP-binding cassette protein MsbA